MTAPAAAPPVFEVPLKCAPRVGIGVPENPCREPGSLLRCVLCPESPSYWRKAEKS